MTSPDRPDYARFGRQMLLADVGATGQTAIAHTAVDFVGEAEVVALAEAAHRRAGGLCGPEADPGRVVVLPGAGASPAARLGVAAAGAVEAARRVLGAPPGEVPAALVARLRGDGDAG
jgi:hypothetical protein